MAVPRRLTGNPNGRAAPAPVPLAAAPTTSLYAGPPVLDLSGIRAGDANLFQITVLAGGLPVNLTGCTVAAQARNTPDATDPAALTAVCTITDAANGVFTMAWPGDLVAALLTGATTWNGVWDVQVTDTAGKIRTVAAGKFAAELDVTRP